MTRHARVGTTSERPGYAGWRPYGHPVESPGTGPI